MSRTRHRTRLLKLSAGFLPVPIRKLSHCAFSVYNVESIQGLPFLYGLLLIKNGAMMAWCIFTALTRGVFFPAVGISLCSRVASQQCRWTVVAARRGLWWSGQLGWGSSSDNSRRRPTYNNLGSTELPGWSNTTSASSSSWSPSPSLSPSPPPPSPSSSPCHGGIARKSAQSLQLILIKMAKRRAARVFRSRPMISQNDYPT